MNDVTLYSLPISIWMRMCNMHTCIYCWEHKYERDKYVELWEKSEILMKEANKCHLSMHSTCTFWMVWCERVGQFTIFSGCLLLIISLVVTLFPNISRRPLLSSSSSHDWLVPMFLISWARVRTRRRASPNTTCYTGTVTTSSEVESDFHWFRL